MPHTDGAGQKHKQQPHHHHGQQKHLVPRRRNTDIENAALSKRQKELMRERRILIFITFLCFLASIVSIFSPPSIKL
jgi:ribosomal protein S30